MAMTRREKLGKQQIMLKMSKEGYPTYASILDLFELNLTKDPGVIGYMVPEKGIIVVNEGLDIDQVSVIIRHEILHEFLEHKKRGDIAHIPMGQLSNMAADYEISNLGYTEADKRVARAIKLGDKVLQGLVTDYDHPEWVNMTFEEMYQELVKESPQSKNTPQIGDRGSKQIQDAEDAQRRAQAIKERAEDMEEQASQQLSDDDGQGSSGGQEDDSESQDSSGSGSSDQDSGQEKEDSDSSSSSSSSDDSSESGDSSSGDDSNEEGKSGKRGHAKYDDDEYKKMSPEEKKKERARRRREAAKKLKEEADKLIDEISDVLDDAKGKSDSGQDGEVFDTPEEQKERAERIAKIKKALSDLSTAETAKREAGDAIMKERAAKASKDLGRYRMNSLTKFTESLTKFIRDQVAKARGDSWAHINKKYVYSGLLKPGSSYQAKGNIPLVNVYYDRSGSWDAGKTVKGNQAIATLNKYVVRGELAVKLYYFHDDEILDHDTPGGRGSGGTYGQPIVDHIKQTKPNNVIILTDSDISDIREYVQVPGAVWILWYGGVSQNLKEHITGRQLTRSFEIEE